MTTDTTAPTAANDSKEASDASRQGPGRLIRLARERARLEVSELASLTKLTPSTLEALERDDFNVLNEPVYVRGYYRKCAKALVINEQDLISAYEKLVRPKAPQAPTKLLIGSGEGKTGLKSGSHGGGMRWLWVIVAGALIGLAFWFLREDPNARHALASAPAEVSNLTKPSLAAPAPAASAEPAPTAPAAATPPSSARPLSTNELSTTPAESGQTQAAEPAPQAAPAHAAPGSNLALSQNVTPPPPPAAAEAPAASAEPAAPAVAGPESLTLDFKSTSWVRIEDSSGKVLMSGVIQSGQHQVVSGKPPYSLFVGNAPGVAVQYQGQTVDLQPYTKSNATARLSVPASAQ
jgi:cytoskeleton protein RodZ